jgi:rSAM/selenodomain-associated transferase 1
VRSVIILFAKAPIEGNVKTRLCPPLTAIQACELHSAFVCDTLERLQTIKAEIELHTDCPTDAWQNYSVTRKLQTSGDLGLKMLHALEGALASGASPAMVLGSDVPTLPAAQIELVLQGSDDVTLGPVSDGGYYAISCRRTDPGMFDGVRWATSAVLDQTAMSAKRCGLSVGYGPEWFDVDYPADLHRLFSSGSLPRHTAAWLARNSLDVG